MTVWTLISILLTANLVIGIIVSIVNSRDSRNRNAFWDVLMCFSVIVCIGLTSNATPKKPEMEFVNCIHYFQENKIEEPKNEDGSRLCAKYLKEENKDVR